MVSSCLVILMILEFQFALYFFQMYLDFHEVLKLNSVMHLKIHNLFCVILKTPNHIKNGGVLKLSDIESIELWQEF